MHVSAEIVTRTFVDGFPFRDEAQVYTQLGKIQFVNAREGVLPRMSA